MGLLPLLPSSIPCPIDDFCLSPLSDRRTGTISAANGYWRRLHVTLLRMRLPSSISKFIYCSSFIVFISWIFLLLIIYSFSVLISGFEPRSVAYLYHCRRARLLSLDILLICCTLPQPCSARSGHIALAIVRILIQASRFVDKFLCVSVKNRAREEPGT